MATGGEIRNDEAAPEPFSEERRRLRDAVRARFQDRLVGDAQLKKAFDVWVSELSSEDAAEGAFWPLTSAEAVEAVEHVHVAMIEYKKAEDQEDYFLARLRAARDDAQNEVGFRERVPDAPWEVDFFRTGIVLKEEPQSPQELVDATLFLARGLDDDALRSVARGELHPWVRERVGSAAPAEYYRDVAELLMAEGDVFRTIIENLCEEPRFLRPVRFFAQHLSDARS